MDTEEKKKTSEEGRSDSLGHYRRVLDSPERALSLLRLLSSSQLSSEHLVKDIYRDLRVHACACRCLSAAGGVQRSARGRRCLLQPARQVEQEVLRWEKSGKEGKKEVSGLANVDREKPLLQSKLRAVTGQQGVPLSHSLVISLSLSVGRRRWGVSVRANMQKRPKDEHSFLSRIFVFVFLGETERTDIGEVPSSREDVERGLTYLCSAGGQSSLSLKF